MSDDASDRPPELQMKLSGSPPRPPKKTGRGLEDDSENPPLNPFSFKMLELTTRIWVNLVKVEGGTARPRICESLETDLDEDILLLSHDLDKLVGEDQKLAMDCLRAVRDYRRGKPRRNPTIPAQAEEVKKVLEQI
jgi:hypothetical protein